MKRSGGRPERQPVRAEFADHLEPADAAVDRLRRLARLRHDRHQAEQHRRTLGFARGEVSAIFAR